uniref:THO complex subunit 1-like n=1 Tax=Nicotiana tabacum TaxID=4097 RepID=A0A1S4B4I9_TOBAC|nr:PREDICTED: THO complex subunit 1-like [Nicotiana tabacum]
MVSKPGPSQFLLPMLGPIYVVHAPVCRPGREGGVELSHIVNNCILSQAAAVQSGQKIMEYGMSIVDGESSQGQIPRLLDIVLYLCEKEHVEGGMIFQLLEDLTEMSTMRNCEDIFGYIESKQDILGKPELFARGKLVMLRTCNQLLRRLSKANDVVFCGRIIMFLAHFFPLSERSGT